VPELPGYVPSLLVSTKLMPLPYSYDNADARTAVTPITLASRATDG